MPNSSTTLPPPDELERICKGIAALDAMLSEDWEYRYYSFNKAWSKKQRMASMRNGEGDDWFIVFEPSGVFVKSFWHEHRRANVATLYAGLPTKLKPQLNEAAFSMDAVTFGGFHDGTKWRLRGNAKPMTEELAILSGDPKCYRTYAKDYFDVDVPLAAVAHVLAGKKLTAALARSVSTERTLAQLKADLTEIGY